MSKKDKKVEIQLVDAQIVVNGDKFEGYRLLIGKNEIGQIAELNNQFAVVSDGAVSAFFKKVEQAVESIIENYNLNK